MTNVTLAKITRYVLRHACGDRCDRARPRRALRRLNGQEYARVRHAG